MWKERSKYNSYYIYFKIPILKFKILSYFSLKSIDNIKMKLKELRNFR